MASIHEQGMRPIGATIPAVLDRVEDAVLATQGVLKAISFRSTTKGWTAPANDTARQAMLAAALELRGTTYSFRGPDGTLDQWSFIEACAERATARNDLLPVDVGLPSDDAVSLNHATLCFLDWGLREVRPARAEPGDVLLFQAASGGVHPAIMTDTQREFLRVCHSYQARSVVEAWLKDGVFASPGAGRMRLVAAFSFDTPGSPLRAAIRRAA